jgi:hypothetical protein
MGESFIEVGYDPVQTAARQTAGLSPEWQAWATECGTWLSNGAVAVEDAFLTPSAEGYVGDWSDKLSVVSPQVQALGMTTGSGANLVNNADADSTDRLNLVGHHVDSGTRQLSRAIGT